jgi:hypothetical protein
VIYKPELGIGLQVRNIGLGPGAEVVQTENVPTLSYEKIA